MKKKLVYLGGILVLLLLIVVVFGFIFLGSIVKAGVESAGPLVTKVPVKLGSATVSVFNGSGKLSGLEVGNPEGFKAPVSIKFGSAALALSPASILADKVIIHSINVEGPEITYEQSLKGNNLSKILENVQSLAGTNTAAPAQPKGASKKLQVDEFVISGGRITVAATMLGGKGATLPLPEIRLANLGQTPEGITPAELVEKALSAITKGTIEAVAKGAGELAKQGLDTATGATTKAGDTAKKVGSGITDMFKKKQ